MTTRGCGFSRLSRPDAKLAVFHSGHVPHTTDPQAFTAELVPFGESVFA